MSQAAQISTLTRNTSLSCLARQIQRKDLCISEVERTEVLFFQWMCITLLADPTVRVTFKVHFMARDAAAMAAPLFQRDARELRQEQAIDFVREYSNLATASLKRSLESCGVSPGVSLPIVTRGCDELFFYSYSGDDESFTDCWSILSGNDRLFLSTLIVVQDDAVLHGIPTSPVEDSSGDGDVDFL